MSNPQPLNPQASKRLNQSDYESITSNAILIWFKEGPSFDFDIDFETDDYEYYQAFLSIIRPDRLSPIPLVMTSLYNSKERAMRDLDNTLKDMVKRGVKKEVQHEEFDLEKALALIKDIKARKF